jgi:hypothetical protein
MDVNCGDVRHINFVRNKRGHGRVEIVSQSNIDVTDVLLGTLGTRPLCETFQKFLDGHE